MLFGNTTDSSVWKDLPRGVGVSKSNCWSSNLSKYCKHAERSGHMRNKKRAKMPGRRKRGGRGQENKVAGVSGTSHIEHLKIWGTRATQWESSSRWQLRAAGSFRSVITGAEYRGQWFSRKPPVPRTEKRTKLYGKSTCNGYKLSWSELFSPSYFLL